MNTYLYRCPRCGKEDEVRHSISECDNPSEETALRTSCNQNTCENEHAAIGESWVRVPQLTNFLSFGSGDLMKGGTLSQEEKHARIRKRADTPTKKDIEHKKFRDDDFKKQAAQIIKGERG